MCQRLKNGDKINAIFFDSNSGDVYIQVNGYASITINQIAGTLMTPTATVVSSKPSSAIAITIRNVTLT